MGALSMLDNDLYKLTMQQAVHALYPRAEARYQFTNRGSNTFPEGFVGRLNEQINRMATLQLSQEEMSYLEETCYFLTPTYLDFLRHYRYDPSEVRAELHHGNLHLTISGPWVRTILWEVPLMALVSELYFEMVGPAVLPRMERRVRNITKARVLRDGNVQFADFGTRRRFSAENHEEVLTDILEVSGNSLVGTSNLHFAKKLGIKPIGTHAHEWFMFHAGLHGYRLANETALDAWTKVYNGHLGIALTDTYTTDSFLPSFDATRARVFDGVRQDSGDPLEFTSKMLQHYRKLHIDPLTRTIVFSDGLNTERAVRIRKRCENKINASFGIGTYLSNDVGPKALNMVIKLSESRLDSTAPWRPAVKLSDVAGKHSGSPDEIALCIDILQVGGRG